MAIYSSEEWKPLYIIIQIVCNQCWFYAIWMNLHYLASIIFGMRQNTSMLFFFSDYEFSLVDKHFYLIISELTLTSRAPIIVYISERAKKCFDFCSTIFLIHLFICVINYGIPLTLYWWVTMISCMIGLTLVTERIATRRELQEILVEDILNHV